MRYSEDVETSRQRRSLPSPKRFAQAGRIPRTLNVPSLLEAKYLSARI